VDRDVHAKVYRFFDPDDRRETFFVGSVNLTNAGFGRAGNVESGFLVETEGKRRSDWWLEVDDRRPATFMERGESDNLAMGPGVNLGLRFDWTTGTARALWDADKPSPPLTILRSGVLIGVIASLPSRSLTTLDATFAERLKEQLRSSSFVTVAVENEPDVQILVDEEGAQDKPSLLTTLSPDEILRFWSLLTDAQKQEFLEYHARELGDAEILVIAGSPPPPDTSVFSTFAHIYLSFGNLERAVRSALEKGRRKEAVDRLFGQKFDSLRRLVERISDSGATDPVRDYVTLLCALQLLKVLSKDEPDFYAAEKARFDLTADIDRQLEQRRSRFTFAEEEERARFFEWFDRWFVRRAEPAPERVPA
jgi:hypothetical protein